jgi:hypothetical protein
LISSLRAKKGLPMTSKEKVVDVVDDDDDDDEG